MQTRQRKVGTSKLSPVGHRPEKLERQQLILFPLNSRKSRVCIHRAVRLKHNNPPQSTNVSSTGGLSVLGEGDQRAARSIRGLARTADDVALLSLVGAGH